MSFTIHKQPIFRLRLSFFTLLVAVAVLFADSQAAQAKNRSPYPIHIQITKVKNGDSTVRLIEGNVIYRVPKEKLWSLILRFNEYKDFFKRVTESRMVEARDGSRRFSVVLDLPFPLPNIHNVFDVKLDKTNYEVRWKKVKGNLKKNEGRSRLLVEGDSVRMAFEIELDIGRFVPQFVFSWAARKFIPLSLTRIGDEMAKTVNRERGK